jgi:hypothetical protein
LGVTDGHRLTTDEQQDWLLAEIQNEVARYEEQKAHGLYNEGFVKGCLDAYVRVGSVFGLADRQILGDFIASSIGDVPPDLAHLLSDRDG